MNDLPVTRDPFYAQRILGSLGGGQTWQVASKKCLAQSCFFVKSSEFGQRITLSRCDFVRSGVDYCWYVEIVSFCVFSAIKSLDKHLHKVDGLEIVHI